MSERPIPTFDDVLAEVEREYGASMPVAMRKRNAINRFRNTTRTEPPVSLSTWELNEISMSGTNDTSLESVSMVDAMITARRLEIEREFSRDAHAYYIVFDQAQPFTPTDGGDVPYGATIVSGVIVAKRSDIEFIKYLKSASVAAGGRDEVEREVARAVEHAANRRRRDFLEMFFVRSLDIIAGMSEAANKDGDYSREYFEFNRHVEISDVDVEAMCPGSNAGFVSLSRVGTYTRMYTGNGRLEKAASDSAYPARTWKIGYDGTKFSISLASLSLATPGNTMTTATITQIARFMRRLRHVAKIDANLPEAERRELSEALTRAGYVVD
jgi:hypothetical protein